MKICQNFQIQYFTETDKTDKFCSASVGVNTPSSSCNYTYPAIYFTGKFNPAKSTPSRINFPTEKEKLVRQFDNILKNDVSEEEMTKEELHLYRLNQNAANAMRIAKKIEAYQNQVNILCYCQGYLPQTSREQGIKLQKEILKLKKALDAPLKFEQPKRKVDPNDAKTDFVLITKFKSAISDDNYDLKRVYMEHYSGLNDIKSIRELKKAYPKIDVPKNPKEVVAKKIEGSLTRDFYEELDSIHKTGDKDAYKKFITDKVQSIVDSNLRKSTPEEQKEINRKLIPAAVSCVNKRYKKIKEEDSFSSIPYIRKQNPTLISDIDKKLLTLDYNDFVLTVIRNEYLGMKKPNEIVYTYNKGKPGHRVEKSISVSELRNSEYRFTKVPENIKRFITTGEELKFAQRNYDYFSKEEFLKRLEFHADKQEPNEEFLDTLINFSTCRFEGEDYDMVRKFLREADEVLDGKKSMSEALDFIYRNDIHPRGTARINEMERQRQIEKIKAEQKYRAEVKHLQTKFDTSMELLYNNDMAYTAELCLGFRPVSNDAEQCSKSDYIEKVIKKYTDPKNPKVITNKDRLASEITRWKKYLEYSSAEGNSGLLKKAEDYARKKGGRIDYDKAGKYLINWEAVETFNTSKEFARNKEAASIIMEKYGDDKEKAVEYFCKYDDYLDMSDSEKSKISNILKVFDKKDSVDKLLLKPIIEKEYVNVPTTEWAQMNESGSKKVMATIAPKAKQELLDYYKFPKCVDYFDLFEYALPQFATTFSSAGIKKLDKNLYELKIMGHDDRLLAQNDSYWFDKFDETGLH